MIRAVLLFPVLILGLYGLGEFIRHQFFGPENFSIGKIARSLAFGIFAHAFLMTVLGFIGLLTPIISALITALPALIFLKFWLSDLKSLFSKSSWKPSVPFNSYELIFLILIVIITLIRGFNALAPNISWDATSHHYLVPSVWLETGRVSDLPSVVFSYYPSLTEMGIAGTMALGTDFLSNLYGWLYGVLSIFLLYSICVRHGRLLIGESGYKYFRLAGLTSAIIFTLFPGVGVQTSGGYVDLPLAVWILLTIDLLLELQNKPSWKHLIAVGLVSGAVLSTKHIGLIIFPGFIIYLVWSLSTVNKNRDTKIPILPYTLAFISISLIVPLCWYIRSFDFTGNPIFPFGAEIGLPTLPHPPFTSESWVRPDYDRSLIGFLTYWLYLTFSPKVAAALGRNYSMLFPFLLPLVLYIPKLKPSGRFIAILSFFTVLVMYKLFPVETRYHIPFIAAMSLSFGLLFARFVENPNYLMATGFIWLTLIIGWIFNLVSNTGRALEVAVVGILTAIPTIWLLSVKKSKWHAPFFGILFFIVIFSFQADIKTDDNELDKRYKAVLNLESEDKYMLRESPLNYGAIHHINNDENWREMKILCLEPRLYRLKAEWVTWFGLEEPIVPTTPAENVAIWYRGGFTHILLGDDVSLKALMYYNIVHEGGWDIDGATPEELVEWLENHPAYDKVTFKRSDLWFNLVGDPLVTQTSEHFRDAWLQREIEKELYTEIEPRVYQTSRLAILTDPERLAQYSFVRDFRELVDSGGLKVAWTDELTFLFECDYPAYLSTHPSVDLETLGLE